MAVNNNLQKSTIRARKKKKAQLLVYTAVLCIFTYDWNKSAAFNNLNWTHPWTHNCILNVSWKCPEKSPNNFREKTNSGRYIWTLCQIMGSSKLPVTKKEAIYYLSKWKCSLYLYLHKKKAKNGNVILYFWNFQKGGIHCRTWSKSELNKVFFWPVCSPKLSSLQFICLKPIGLQFFFLVLLNDQTQNNGHMLNIFWT